MWLIPFGQWQFCERKCLFSTLDRKYLESECQIANWICWTLVSAKMLSATDLFIFVLWKNIVAVHKMQIDPHSDADEKCGIVCLCRWCTHWTHIRESFNWIFHWKCSHAANYIDYLIKIHIFIRESDWIKKINLHVMAFIVQSWMCADQRCINIIIYSKAYDFPKYWYILNGTRLGFWLNYSFSCVCHEFNSFDPKHFDVISENWWQIFYDIMTKRMVAAAAASGNKKRIKLTRNGQNAGCVVDQIVHDWQNGCVGEPFQ